MSFNTTVGRKEYTASASQKAFPFAFKIYQTSDVKVYLTPAGSQPDEVADLLTLGIDYNVSINGDAGGTVTLTSGAANGDEITILRRLDITRTIQYQTNGDLLASTLNQDQDYQGYLIADMQDKIEKVVKMPDNAQGVSGDIPSPSPQNYIRWNDDGTALENDTTAPGFVTEAETARDASIAAKVAAESAQSGAETAETGATTQAGIATTKANEATASATESEHWANYPENTAVPEGTGEFSAKHYATKASQYATQTAVKTNVRNTVISDGKALTDATTPTATGGTFIYTGNGTSQDIVTGLPSTDANWYASASYTAGDYRIHNYVIYQALTTHSGVATTPDADTTNWVAVADGVSVPFNNAAFEFKSRSIVADHRKFDTLRGATKWLASNLTNAEGTDANSLTSFNVDGVTVGSASQVNQSYATYVLSAEYYDSMVSYETNHGKRAIVAYNAQSGKGMVIYQGSGLAGHEIPHGLGTEIDFWVNKERNSGTSSWRVFNSHSGIDSYLSLDTNDAVGDGSTLWDGNDTQAFILSTGGTVNRDASEYVAYFSSNRDSHTFTTPYQGTGAAGNVIKLPFSTVGGIEWQVKRLDSTGNWYKYDSVRSLEIKLNSSDTETNRTIHSFTDDSIIFGVGGSEDAQVNASGGQYLLQATIPTYAKPNGGLKTVAGTRVTYASGVNENGDINFVDTLEEMEFTPTNDATNYYYVDYDDVGDVSSAGTTVYPRIETDNYTAPDANSDTYDIVAGVTYTTSGTPVNRVYLGEAYVDGTGEYVPDTLVEYPHRKQYGTSMVLTDDLEVRGKFSLGRKWEYLGSSSDLFVLEDVVYTNNRNKDEEISITAYSTDSANTYINVFVDELLIGTASTSLNADAATRSITMFTVPVGSTWRFTMSGTTKYYWVRALR